MTSVTLTSVELMIAAQAGAIRRVSSIKDRLDKNKHAEKSDWATDVDGAAAEMAFAKFLNLYWCASNRTFKEPDVGTWQVRSTSHENGHLIVRQNDKDLSARYVLVITDPPVFEIIGFIHCADARVDKYRRGDCWWVPQSDLQTLGA